MNPASAKASGKRTIRGEDGRSILELIAVVTIVAVVAAYAVQGIDSGRRQLRVENTAREFQSYLEKARVDSLRRHAVSSAAKASVQIVNATSYSVSIDFSGSGSTQTRTISLAQGSSFNTGSTVLPITISFDWRGRGSATDGNSNSTTASFTVVDDTNQYTKVITVSHSGDAGTNSVTVTKPTVSTVTGNVNIRANTNEASGTTVSY